MARIELSNIGGGGGTTLSLTTTGTSGAATLAGSVLNIPIYQGQLTLTTTGTSGAATLSGDILNIPQYSGGGGTPAGSAGQVQFNSTPAGSFAASANLAWDNSAVQLSIGAPSGPTGKLNVKGGGATSSTVNLRLTDSGNTELFKVLDSGNTNIGTGFNWDNVNSRLGLGTSTPSTQLEIRAGSPSVPSLRLTSPSATIPSFSGVGFSPQITTNTTAIWEQLSVTNGGVQLFGFNVANTQSATIVNGITGSTSWSNTVPAVVIRAYSWNGTNNFASSSGDAIICGFNNGTSNIASFRANGNVNIGSAFIPSARLQVRGANTTAAVGTFIVEDGAATPATIYRIDNDGKVTYRATNTAAGTTGAQTINRPSGTVNFAIGAGSLVVTNSLCTTSSIVFATVRTNDATAYIKNVVPAAGSFTINLGAAATAETSVGFFIIN